MFVFGYNYLWWRVLVIYLLWGGMIFLAEMKNFLGD